MITSEVIRFDLAVKRIIRRELAEAHRKFGNRFDLLVVEQSWGYTLDDMKMLSVIRRFNRTGTFFTTASWARPKPAHLEPRMSDRAEAFMDKWLDDNVNAEHLTAGKASKRSLRRSAILNRRSRTS